jgi:hypothetical protein
MGSRPYLVSHCSEVTETSNSVLIAMLYKQLNLGQPRSETKGTLLLRPKQFFLLISPRIAVGEWDSTSYTTCICCTGMYHVAQAAHALRAVPVRFK